MKRLGLARLVDALAEWGGHETETHDAQPRSSEAMENIDLCLRRRAPLVARIIVAEPVGCLRVEFEPEEQLALFIADGRPLDEWTDSVLRDQGRSGNDVRARVASPDSMAGALVCTAVVPAAGGMLEPQKHGKRKRPVEEKPRSAQPMLLQQPAEPITYCLRKGESILGPADRLAALRRRRHKREDSRRNAGAVNVAPDVVSAVAADVQGNDEIRSVLAALL